MSPLPAPAPAADRAAEARRQAALLAAIQCDAAPNAATSATAEPATADTPATDTAADTAIWHARGLALHRAHARACARATLRLSHPTVEQVLGTEAFEAVAWRLWQTAPPTSGDLGDWGATLPGLLARQPELQPWPWLPDLARLDHARHRCERAADQACDLPSLARLGDTDPARLHLRLQDHVIVLPSPWPLAAIWSAHQPGGDLDALASRLAQVACEPNGGAAPETVTVVWRQPWRAEVADLSGPEAAWMRALARPETAAQRSPNLSTLLEQALPGLDVGAWLALALQRQWLAGVDVDVDVA